MAKKNTLFKDKQISLEARDFYSDFTSEEMLHGSLIRSPASSGRVSSINIPDLPEGYSLFTAEQMPGQNKVNINGVSIPVFTQGNVSYKGEVLGILVGPDPEKVNELAQSAEISFDINSLESAFQSLEKKYKKPAVDLSGHKTARSVSDFSSFLEELNDMPSLDTVQSTISAQKSLKSLDGKVIADRVVRTGLFKTSSIEKALEDLFPQDQKIFEGSWQLNQVDSLWQETNGAFCKMEKDILHVCTPTKWSYLLQDILVQALNLPEDKIVIHKTKTSGTYSNGIWKNAILATQVSVASLLTQKPVKLILSQEEQNLFAKPGCITEYQYKTTVSPEGKIKAMYIEIEMDAGCTNPYAQEIIDRLTISSVGIYKPENLYINARAITSANPPTSIYPKIIDSQSFFGIENHMQTISEELHISPDELRIINIEKQNKQFFISLPVSNPEETINSLIIQSDFRRKFFTYKINAQKRASHHSDAFFALPLRGIGFSCAYDGSGFFGKTIYSCDQKMELTFNSPEDIVIHSLKPSGIVENIWKQTCAKYLEVDPSAVKINSEFSAKELPNIPEETTSSISVLNYLLQKCCEEVQKKRFKQPLPISVKKQLPPSVKNKWNDSTFSGVPFHAASFASAVIEIEVDSYTYMEKIKGLWLTVNCGRLYDKKAAEKTLKLAIQQELTTLVSNAKVACENIKINFIESDEKPGQIGELVHYTIPSAFSSALSLALSTTITTLPVSQRDLYDLIKQRESEIRESEIRESEVIENDIQEASLKDETTTNS